MVGAVIAVGRSPLLATGDVPAVGGLAVPGQDARFGLLPADAVARGRSHDAVMDVQALRVQPGMRLEADAGEGHVVDAVAFHHGGVAVGALSYNRSPACTTGVHCRGLPVQSQAGQHRAERRTPPSAAGPWRGRGIWRRRGACPRPPGCCRPRPSRNHKRRGYSSPGSSTIRALYRLWNSPRMVRRGGSHAAVRCAADQVWRPSTAARVHTQRSAAGDDEQGGEEGEGGFHGLCAPPSAFAGFSLRVPVVYIDESRADGQLSHDALACGQQHGRIAGESGQGGGDRLAILRADHGSPRFCPSAQRYS